MGAWSTALYGCDAALDVRETVTSLLRLPVDADEIVRLLVDASPSLADPRDEDYCDGWFAVADRFHKYGIEHEPTYDLARSLVTSGADLEMKEALGLSPADLRARRRVLDALIERISVPAPKPFKRKILGGPQPLVVSTGEVLSFPVQHGRSANPYFRDWAEEGFEPDAYGVAVVTDTGHTFGYLAWCAMAVLDATWPEPPRLEECLDTVVGPAYAGTLTAAHRRKIALATVSTVTLGPGVERLVPPYPGAVGSVTTNDVSISDSLTIPSIPRYGSDHPWKRDVTLQDIIQPE